MKLVICIVHSRDRGKITEEFVRAGYKFTIIGSTGGFLKEGNTTILVGIEEEELTTIEGIIAKNCKAREQMVNVGPFETAGPGAMIPMPIKVPVGGAVVFVLPVEQFHRF